MRKISAHLVLAPNGKFLKQAIVHVDDSHRVLELIDTAGAEREIAGLEFYNGILVPGFVNAHVHLELSWLKNKIEPGKGMIGFLEGVTHEKLHGQIDEQAIDRADKEMYNEGIVMAGDISNGIDSFETKKGSRLKYHTFVEILGRRSRAAQQVMDSGKETLAYLQHMGLEGNLTPHAPYSISGTLWDLIHEHFEAHPGMFCIHNQESEDENLLFGSKTGHFPEFLSRFDDEFEQWIPTGQSSLQSILKKFPRSGNILLVHNNWISLGDLEVLRSFAERVYLVLCPKSNQYIGNPLPPIEMLTQQPFKICLGSDSLASNTKLSMLDEIRCIQENFPHVRLNELLTWATLNGALALGKQVELGSFEQGKRPGVNLIEHVDLQQQKLTPDSQVRRLI
jgi:aminodeoxyfutalosine deaminase